jgi:hypothetical protein
MGPDGVGKGSTACSRTSKGVLEVFIKRVRSASSTLVEEDVRRALLL